MASEIGEAIGAIGGIAFGGIILLMIAPQLNQVSIINLTGLGIIYVLAAVVLAAGLVYSMISSLGQ
jgi:hypothetical protein